jgi:hypothetical protein
MVRKLQTKGMVLGILLGVLSFTTDLSAQTTGQQPSRLQILQQQQMITGGVGLTVIDGTPYYLFHLMPELTFGKIGVGLDLNIRVGKDGKIRKEDFNEAYDYLRLIRYVRYGLKRDPLYVRVGALDYARLGHGSIVHMYCNSASYDARKIGLELDADFEKFGFESMYGDVAGAAVLGVRGYLKPLQYTSAAGIPIIGSLEMGVTFASDFNPDAHRTWGDAVGLTQRAQGGGSLSIIGLDLGLPLLSLNFLRSTLYADYAKIFDYGSGVATGVDLDFTGLQVVTLSAKYERRFAGDQFLPSYFDALYERDRYQVIDTTRFVSKAQVLKNSPSFQGNYGELLVSILGTFNVLGSYQSPVGVRNAGTIHLEIETGSALPGIILTGGFDRKSVGSVFKVDNNSVLYAQVGYKPLPYLVVSTLYEWTYAEEKDLKTGRVTGYKTQRRIEPRVSFVTYF